MLILRTHIVYSLGGKFYYCTGQHKCWVRHWVVRS